MKPAEMKERLSLLKGRLKNLWPKYPVVAISLVLAGALVGFLLAIAVMTL